MKNNKKKEVTRKKYDVAKLHNSDDRKAFCLELKNRFEVLEDDLSGDEEVERLGNIWITHTIK